jgi:TatD DNase family protein
LDQAISESPIIGEIGLDYYFVNEISLYDDQRKVFEYLLRAANNQNKIVIVHTKGAEKDTSQFLRQYNIERAIIHWYSGPWHILEAMVEHGFYFTIGIEVMYSQHIQNIAGYLPSELILTETDNPGGYKSITGTVGTPLLIKEVIGKIAEIRGVSEQIIVTTVRNNLIRIGGNDPWLARLLSSTD